MARSPEMARKFSRGSFLKTLGAGAVAGSTLSILSCSVSTSPQQGGDGGDGGGGGNGGGGDQLNLYNWSDYVAPEETLPGFEEETGIRVTQDFYASNEELLARLQSGASGYDVIVPSDYMVAVMAKSDVLQELDFEQIPNFENVGADFRGLPYDPDNTYSIPYQWGTTGLLYNRAEIGEITTWEAAFDPQFEGRIAMIDDVRETLGAALMSLGYSINSTDEAELDEARQILVDQKPLLRGYFDSTEVVPLVVNGDILIGHVFSGDGMTPTMDNEDLAYIIPEPAATRWTDNMCVPNGARNVEGAHQFINYILSVGPGAALTNYTYYGTPNEAALPEIDSVLTEIPEYDPPEEVFDRLQVIEDVGEATREYERIFTEVKSA